MKKDPLGWRVYIKAVKKTPSAVVQSPITHGTLITLGASLFLLQHYFFLFEGNYFFDLNTAYLNTLNPIDMFFKIILQLFLNTKNIFTMLQ